MFSFYAVYLYLFFYSLNLLLIFFLIFKITSCRKNFTSISSLLYLNPTVRWYFTIASLSLLGLPPLSGFILKFCFMLVVLLKTNIFYFFIFFLLALISVYFYLKLVKVGVGGRLQTQQLRELSSHRKPIFFFEAYVFSLFSFFNIFFIFFYKDFFLIFSF